MNVSIVDTPSSVVSLLDELANQPTNPPSLYLDVEGIRLCRHGSISIIQVYQLPRKHTYLIDVHGLQEAAFDTPNKAGATLRTILELPTIPKVFFDVRNDADALYAHFNISLQGVEDIQLLEVATHSWRKDHVFGLGRCIENDANLSKGALRQWKIAKEKGLSLFAVEHGGSYEVFNLHPLPQDIISYYTQDVAHLPALWQVYMRKIGNSWLRKVRTETGKRLMLAHDETYDPHGKGKALSPWPKAAKNGKKAQTPQNGEVRVKAQGQIGGGILEKKPLSAAEISATKAVHRKAQKQLDGHMLNPSQAEGSKPQPSDRKLARKDAQSSVINVASSTTRPFPSAHLPARYILGAQSQVVAIKETENSPATGNSNWTCTICDRNMHRNNQEVHVAGRAHRTRLEEATKDTSNVASESTTAGEASIPATRSATKAGQQGNATAAGNLQRIQFVKVGSKSTRRGSGENAAASHIPSQGAPYPDALYIPFESHGYASISAYDPYSLGGGDDWSICDKDCGWCGQCMDNVHF